MGSPGRKGSPTTGVGADAKAPHSKSEAEAVARLTRSSGRHMRADNFVREYVLDKLRRYYQDRNGGRGGPVDWSRF